MPYKDKEKAKKHKKQYYLDNAEKQKLLRKINHKHIEEYDKQYRIDNHDTIREKAKIYYYNNIEKIKQYRINNREQIARNRKEYDKQQKYNFRRRSLGFYPLNEYMKGFEAHHISQNFVIYMPKEVHRSIFHNIWTGRNMEQMNKLAVSFL